MTTGGFAAILARLRAPQLRLHCDEALHLELTQTQLRLHDVSAAMQRLRDVGSAARTLRSSDGAALSASLLAEMDRMQRALGRAVAAFGTSDGARAPRAEMRVCCTCGGLEKGAVVEEPLLTRPDTAALSPPRRPRPAPVKKSKAEAKKKPKTAPAPRKKLVIQRKNTPPPDDEEEKSEQAEKKTKKRRVTPKQEKKAPPPPPPTRKKQEEKEESVKEELDDVVVVEDESDDSDDSSDDARTRLHKKIDACWPLATRLGALEMPQRRRADYADLVRRVCALFRALLACDVDDMASRSMRSVLVKARDALAVAVSLLSLHEVTDANASTILALVKAVDTASEKHATLQKHVAPFRNSLADFEVALLTRSYTAPTTEPTANGHRKKPRASR